MSRKKILLPLTKRHTHRQALALRWSQFTEIREIKKEMFQRLELKFENWLNP
jgi:hypothetical protein